MDYDFFFSNHLDRLKKEGNYRIFTPIQRHAGRYPNAYNPSKGEQKDIIVWCSNDYLGMGQHPEVLAAMHHTLDMVGAGAGGTRNISGTNPFHFELEQELATWHHKQAALLFSSGYVANVTTLETLGKHLPNCIFFSDEENHASIIQGIRNSRAEKHIFKHNDPDDLERLLQQADPHRPKIIVFEAVYSMSGDIAPIADFCALAERYNALTYLDEVHSVGLYGATGAGIAEQQGLSDRITIIQGGLGKAIGLMGGYIAATGPLVDFVRSHAPGFIFTTALPPTIVAGILASIRYLKRSPQERIELHRLTHTLKQQLATLGISYLPSDSHIVPVIIAGAHHCKEVSQRLLEQHGIYVQPINYPTVPRGLERLRITPTVHHTPEMIQAFAEALASLLPCSSLQAAA